MECDREHPGPPSAHSWRRAVALGPRPEAGSASADNRAQGGAALEGTVQENGKGRKLLLLSQRITRQRPRLGPNPAEWFGECLHTPPPDILGGDVSSEPLQRQNKLRDPQGWPQGSLSLSAGVSRAACDSTAPAPTPIDGRVRKQTASNPPAPFERVLSEPRARVTSAHRHAGHATDS